MLDGLPFHLFEESRNCDWNIGQHKKRKGEGVSYLFGGRAIYMLPLGNCCNCTDDKKHQICIEQRLTCGLKKYNQVFFRMQSICCPDQINDTTESGQKDSWKESNGHIVTGEALVF